MSGQDWRTLTGFRDRFGDPFRPRSAFSSARDQHAQPHLETRQSAHSLLDSSTVSEAANDVSELISDITNLPVAVGGYSDIYRAVYNGSTSVAVKRLRFNTHDKEKKENALMKECSLLAQLDHMHILSCLGFCCSLDSVCMVSPWAENGSMCGYLQRFPDAQRIKLLSEVASALLYLHTRPFPVVHGDLHIDNVLISSQGYALLSDFGLSRVLELPQSGRSVSGTGGVLVYQAPELHYGKRCSPASDVFAFGMLVVETYSGFRPLRRFLPGIAAVIAISNGERPSRDEVERLDFADTTWTLAQACWDHKPHLRPEMSDVQSRLAQPESRL